MKNPKSYEELECWLDNLVKDANVKLGLDDADLAWIFLRRGTEHYFRTLAKGYLNRGND